MGLMALRPVLFLGAYLTSSTTAEMRSHTFSPMKDLYGGRCGSHFYQLMNQCVGHAVKVGVEGDVVINVHARERPLAQSNRSAGNERSALRSRDANTLARDPSRFRNGRWFNPSSSSRIARFTSSSRKNW